MAARVLEVVLYLILTGAAGFGLYVVAQISRRQREEMLYSRQLCEGSLRRLDAISEAQGQLNAPHGPFALLTGPQATEVHGLRSCGFTWDELVAWAPLWGLDARAVAAERDRIEEVLRG